MAQKKYLAAIDAGTIGSRTMITDTEGNVLALEYDEYPSYFPHPGWVVQNCTDWWDVICKTTHRAIEAARIDPKEIAAVAVTNQRETTTPVGPLPDMEPVMEPYTSIVWQDRRTAYDRWCPNTPGKWGNIMDWIKADENVGEREFYKRVGLTVDPYFSMGKILWIKWHMPEVFEKAACFLCVSGYISSKLCGKFVDDWTNCSRMGLFNITENKWDEYICGRMGIPIEKLPEPHPSGEVVGEVTKRAAEETGFAEGTLVVMGGGDQQCGALGIGVTEPGDIEATTGTGTFMLAYTKEPRFDTAWPPRVLCSEHCIDHVNECSMFTTGVVYRWFRDQFCREEKEVAARFKIDPYEIMNAAADTAKLGSRGTLCVPHFIGAGAPYWDPFARGVFVGLELGTTKEDMMRSILEGACFYIRASIEAMREMGLEIKEMGITGGLTRNETFNWMQAQVYNIPVYLGIEEATPLGACICAGVGAGFFKDMRDGVKKMVKVLKRWEPEPEAVEKYDKLYKIWYDIYYALKEKNIYRRLVEVAGELS